MTDTEILAAVEHWRHVAVSLCRRYSSDWDADDLMQEASLRAWRHRHLFRGDCALTTWTHRILINTYIAHCKLHSVRVMRECVEIDPWSEQLVCTRSVDNERRDMLAKAWNAMHALPIRLKPVMVGWVMGNQDYQQLATAHGIPIGTVRSRISRARAAITAEVGE